MKASTTRGRGLGRRRAGRGGIRRGLLVLLGLVIVGVAAWGFGGRYGGPWLIERGLAAAAEEAEATITTGEVRFNPFTLTAEIGALELTSRTGASRLSAARITLDLAAASLLERRLVASSLLIERPEFRLARAADLMAAARQARSLLLDGSRIDRLELTAARLATPSGSGAPLLDRFSLALTGFDDRAAASARFRFDGAAPDGAEMAVYGTVQPDFSAAEGQLKLSGAELAVIAARLGGPVAAAAPTGLISVTSAFTAASLLTAPSLALSGAAVDVVELALTPAAELAVSSSQINARGNLSFALGAAGLRLGGRLGVDDAALAIRDTQLSPAVTHTVPAATVLITADAATEDFTLIVDGGLAAGGTLALTLRVPGADTATRRVSLAASQLPAAVLSPYAADALGRGLSAGTIEIEADYVLAGERVDGSLSLAARGLEFAAPTAAGLPVAGGESSLELAAALLENADSVLTLQLPFAGFARTAREAAAAALGARVAALSETPFDALAPLLSGQTTASSVPFQPGDTALNDRAQGTIGQLVNVLRERPRLALRVHGGYDPAADRDALARQQIQLHVQLATAGAASQTRAVDFNSALARDVLDEFAGERLPAAEVAELKSQYDCEGAMIPLCRRAYYELIFDALVDNEEIAPTTLNRLARFRAQSIADALTGAGIAAERIEVVAPGNVVDSPFGVGLKVELAAAP